MSSRLDLIGQTFGWLKVHRRIGFNLKHHHTEWECGCVCGKVLSVGGGPLRSGRQVSCGCMADQMKNRTHGLSKSKEYRTWGNMRSRCERPTNNRWSIYGGRGIKVCPEWSVSFERFWNDMGPAPSPSHSIDRINVDGNYEPGNCQWSNRQTQMNNTSRSRRVLAFGESKTIAEWARDPRCVVKRATLLVRINVGWPSEVALSHPVTTDRRCPCL